LATWKKKKERRRHEKHKLAMRRKKNNRNAVNLYVTTAKGRKAVKGSEIFEAST
jgi:hypothetical protein